jgi:hypothetical protein
MSMIKILTAIGTYRKEQHMLTKQNLANLEKLGRYLAKLDTKYQREHFRMQYFMRHQWNDINDPTEAEKLFAECFCGTSACAVGHAPIVLKEETKAIDWRPWIASGVLNRPDKWLFLTIQLFGEDFRGEIIGGSSLFDFMFGGDWGANWSDDNKKYNATSWSAADRIAYLFEIGQDNLLVNMYNEYYNLPFIGAATRMRWIPKGTHAYHMSAVRRHLTEEEYVKE